MDDLTLAGPIDQVEHDIRLIEEQVPTYGLQLNRAKCEASARSYDEANKIQTFVEFENVAVEDLTLLGAPLLPGRAVDKSIQKKIKDLDIVITRLEDVTPTRLIHPVEEQLKHTKADIHVKNINMLLKRRTSTRLRRSLENWSV